MNIRRSIKFTLMSLTIAAASLLPAQAQTIDPAPWTSLLLPAPFGYTPGASTFCPDGATSCVDSTIAQLQTQLTPLVDNCDHKLAFNFFYVRISQAYRNVINNPDYFQNTAYVNRLAALWGGYYLKQYAAWKNHDLANVSPAWQMAFSAADNKQLSALGDTLLAVNAHILGDEPNALDQLGLVYPDGSSAKPDFNLDNVWLYDAYPAIWNEGARRFDPYMNQPVRISQPPFDLLSYQLIAAWREQAWRFAEQLKLAEASHDPIAYQAVRTAITLQTQANAVLIIAATTITPWQAAARDAYCAIHHYDQ